ncbi:glucose-6-phosphate 1-epimerase, putative [Candida dubliniensis CD36]|uniref:Glucose-6-phosphate 1-epimerase n=1 Tax=Candida dubliniensis (strain CD36 / ATCC MYA-646 / CBS 7987 / NCPF 3949 / NRRL Y-17841) TaxID=573826 RepID=B9WH51_CANDC|nr:glucose-6-phosphate 1-epimerase, putative [Candida dubliniensis CD36]CAX41492.1 glucose-6-phosphate 1-epimerase, putative [Candida dubliniensis CD36]
MPVEELEDRVIITDPTDPTNRATILKFGATVVSWKNNNEEKLWLSEGAHLDGSKAVRGGIPLVFPVFGKQKDSTHPTFKLPQHGFARNSTWEFLGQTQESPITVQFGLGPENVDPETLKLWNYDFTLILTVSLTKDNLVTSIDIENTGKEAFEFNWLFHTYYRIHDITDTLVTNLIDQQCYDQLIGESYIEKAPVISFHEEFDRIYSKVNLEKSIQIVDKGKVLFNLHRKNLPDSVVWNPWTKKAEGMADFQPKSGFHQMVCVEPGHVDSMISLPAGGKWSGGQEITIGGDIKVQANIY